jgi:hypothetical protein
MLFRVMFGAGLIKLRGDPCWRDLTCLDSHFETQPIPNPLSWYFHHLPHAVLHGGVLVNHFVELVAPWLLFLSPPACAAAGLAIAAFQGVLILSGNLSFLNYLTLALCLPCFDDRLLAKILPDVLVRRVPAAPDRPPRLGRVRAELALAVVVGLLSVAPVLNLLSPHQAMNASFDPFHIVNTYGAFGSVGQRRLTVVFQGTEDAAPEESSRWLDYQYKCQPVDVARRPCWLSPYHLRLDWQAWFLPLGGRGYEPWTVRLVAKLLDADSGTLGLFAADPFAGRPPRWVRAQVYEYRFTRPGEAGWWARAPVGSYLPPVSRDNPALREFLSSYDPDPSPHLPPRRRHRPLDPHP